ncbi:type VII secretion-associated serine protease mycosin [Streptomyces carminius]|uniref:Type VII secretion-associated serine protease mycosin n=1 Tax=Streptomyces carminius TaxID=2665496 RepID=A0A2M8LSM5_9ACTN|nr:type VII secretion-associated serine protease mycosin [Streptomyces carminius]PJE94962.1 type VII secretion-associated serine protease mycosin [Streptomyces carminius]
MNATDTPAVPAAPAPRPVGTRRAAAFGAALLAVLTVLTGVCALGVAAAPAARADVVRDRQWGLDAVRARDAWRTTRGEGVTVAVLDTGVDAGHPDLRDRVLPGRDLVGFGAREGDEHWARHGTAMAGIIAGRGHGPGDTEGVLGVAPGARILPVRVLLEDGDPERKRAREERGEALAEGIRWAVDHGADVINLSLGDDSAAANPDPAEDAAVRYALARGAVVVASAGNGGEDGDRASYPAAYPGVIAVTAVDRTGARAPFSTRRWYATVAAPGEDVVITYPDGEYYEGWGTSAAAAFVSGCAALVRAAHPELSPAQVRELLTATARDTPPGGRSDALGAGIVDPAAAIERGARVEPRPQLPAAAAHPKRYFGPGPAPEREEDGWLAPAAAAAGIALVVCAVLLYRGARPPGPAGGRPPATG